MAYAVHIKLEELENENTELRNIIAAHAGQIERNKNALFQLFGGLYNPNTQKRILKQHLNSLLGEDEDDEADNEEAEPLEDIWPTTRQGDQHEEHFNDVEEKMQERDEQLTIMEQRLREMEDKINAMEKKQLERLGLNM
jgi:chromosome segregation ATPase